MGEEETGRKQLFHILGFEVLFFHKDGFCPRLGLRMSCKPVVLASPPPFSPATPRLQGSKQLQMLQG